jgi:hypothetical protein
MLYRLLILSIGLHASILSELLEYLCVIIFHVLSVLTRFGWNARVYFYVMLSLLSLGLTMGIG